MTDISTFVGRLLPFAVIASLAMIFYMLDVFAVRPGFDAPIATVAARQVAPSDAPATLATPERRAGPAPVPASPAAESPAPGGTANKFAGESDVPPQGEAPEPSPPATASVSQPELAGSPAPRYVPPARSPGQPLASDMNSPPPIQLPTNEILQEEGERIESENLQALDEAEQAALQQGADEQGAVEPEQQQ